MRNLIVLCLLGWSPLMAAPAVDPAADVALFGEVVIDSAHDGRLVLIAVDADHEGRPGDGLVDAVFELRSLHGEPVSAHFTRANVESLGGTVRVTSPAERRGLFFSLAPGTAAQKQAPHRPAGLDIVEIPAGFELTRYTGPFDLGIAEFSHESWRAYDAAAASKDNKPPEGGVIQPPQGGTCDCDAGGFGSTSCSITSPSGRACSTTCGGGFHACCNLKDGILAACNCLSCTAP